MSHATQRLKEAAKLGFGRAAAPGDEAGDEPEKGVQARGIARIADLVAIIAAGRPIRTVETTAVATIES